jgi:hypothetical protein
VSDYNIGADKKERERIGKIFVNFANQFGLLGLFFSMQKILLIAVAWVVDNTFDSNNVIILWY